MSLAAETRAAVRRRPFLHDALRAGVVNYAAAARMLDVGSDEEAVAVALRRFAEDLPPSEPVDADVRVTMHGGLRPTTTDPLLRVGDHGFSPGGGPLTGVLATGSVAPRGLAHVLDLLRTHGVDVTAAGVAGEALIVVVPRRNGAAAVRHVEDGLGPDPG